MTSVFDQYNRPVKDLRISVMDTCNYRCQYCMPADKFNDDYTFLTPQQRLSFTEITRIVKSFVEIGTEKIRLTGGEPLLRKDLHLLLKEISVIPQIKDLAITTNGVLLAHQLPQLIDAGLNRVTISLDALDDQLFQQMNGFKGTITPVLKAIDAALNSGLKVKINCVVQKELNENQILPLIQHFKGSSAIIRFIEFMDVGNINDWQPEKVVSANDILSIISKECAYTAVQPNYNGEVAKRYVLNDGSLEFGLITSVSNPFCGDCSRARLSADGRLYTCLFANQGHDLKKHIREQNVSNNELKKILAAIWQNRSDKYSEQRSSLTKASQSKIEMYVIGG